MMMMMMMSRLMLLLVVGITVVRCDDKLDEKLGSETVGGFAGGSASATDMGMITIPTTAVDFVQSMMLNPYGVPLGVDAELEDGMMMAPMADDRARVSKTVVRRPIAPGPTVRRTTVVGKRHLLGDDDEDDDDDDDEEEEDENEDEGGDEEGNDGTSPEDQTAVDSLTAEMTATTNAAKEAMMGESLDVDAELEDGMMAPGPEPMMADDRARVRRTTVVRRPIAPGPTVRRTTVVGKRHLLGDDDEDEDDDEDHDDHDHDHDMNAQERVYEEATAATNAANEAMMEEFSDFQDAVIDPMVEELAPSPDALFADDRYFRRTTVVRRRPITGRRVVRRTTVIG
ncbi:hypothetical protein RI054_03g14110 [Pseudoscourfieldia marina]